MGTKEEVSPEQLINRNLKSLIAVIFLFYGGLGCLYSTLVPHLKYLGFYSHEICKILTTVAVISILGPLLIGPIIDRIADRRKSAYGTNLQRTIAILLILGSIVYGALLYVPEVRRIAPSSDQVPLVTFGCNQNGSVIFQQRCSEEKTCFHWKKEKVGSLILTNCTYTCQKPSQFENYYRPWMKNPVQSVAADFAREKAEDLDIDYDATLSDSGSNRNRPKREQVYVEPPHVCSTAVNAKGEKYVTNCHVYTSDYKFIPIKGTLRSASNIENDTHSAEWCNYPLGKEFFF